MPSFANFKLDVIAFANRTSAELTVGGRDLVLAAANMAKAEAQRRHNFKYLRDIAYLSTSLSGELLSNAKTTPGGATAQPIKVVEAAWLYTTVGSSYYRTSRLRFMTTGDQKLNFPTGDSGDLANQTLNLGYIPQSLSCWISGGKIYMTGTTTATAIMLDVIKYSAAYGGSEAETDDFFLQYGYDWLLLKTVDYLNMFLKDDQRVAIAQSRIEQAWTTIMAFDEDYAERAFDINDDE